MSQFPRYPESHPDHPRSTLHPYNGPGLFITATGTDVGKTTVVRALAAGLRRLHARIGICKPVSTGCPRIASAAEAQPGAITNDDFLAPDAALIAQAAGLDPADRSLSRYLSPLCYGPSVSPALASQMEGRPADWHRVATAFDWWQENCDVLIVEGAGGWYVPLDHHDFMIADLASALRLPVLVVTTPALGTLNQTLLTVHAIRQRNLPVMGLVINRVPETSDRDAATESNLTELTRLSGVPVRAMLSCVTEEALAGPIPDSFIDALFPFASELWSMSRPAT